mmetsp:Transcript_26584/g.66599  ORF Transcript_26584/g.66599 Transcript_26584/m.66599 type:complete len:243 (+) Transcript_26584:4362-5090(+)
MQMATVGETVQTNTGATLFHLTPFQLHVVTLRRIEIISHVPRSVPRRRKWHMWFQGTRQIHAIWIGRCTRDPPLRLRRLELVKSHQTPHPESSPHLLPQAQVTGHRAQVTGRMAYVTLLNECLLYNRRCPFGVDITKFRMVPTWRIVGLDRWIRETACLPRSRLLFRRICADARRCNISKDLGKTAACKFGLSCSKFVLQHSPRRWGLFMALYASVTVLNKYTTRFRKFVASFVQLKLRQLL